MARLSDKPTTEELAKQMVDFWWRNGAIAQLHDRRLVEGGIAAEIRAAVEAERNRVYNAVDTLLIQAKGIKSDVNIDWLRKHVRLLEASDPLVDHSKEAKP